MTTFYEAALGYVMHGPAGDQYASMVAADGIGPKLVFQKVPEAKAVKNRVHLDLIVEDIEAEAVRFVRSVRRAARFDEFGMHWIVMHDPEGNEVCLCDGSDRLT